MTLWKRFAATISLMLSALLAAAAQDANDPSALESQVPVADDPVAEEAQVPVADDPALEDTTEPSVDAPAPEEMQVPVAEENAAGEEEGAPEATAKEMLAAQFLRFKELMVAGSLDEADTVAKRVVELAIEANGPHSPEMAKALTNLAIVQHRNEQYEAAQQNYESAIEIIEDVEDRLNDQLVNPLKGLAAAQLASGRPDLAAVTYDRAVHITHVNEGPHNLDQIDLLEDLSEVELRMGDIPTAKEIQDQIFSLNVRAYQNDSMDLVPSLMRRANWQHRAGLIYDERATYRRIIRIVESHKSKDDLALVEPLVRLGRSFFYPDKSGQQAFSQASMASGEIYFKRALRIAAESPDTTWNIVADATLALGDYYMFEGNVQRARQQYGLAWDLLSESGDHPEKIAKRHAELESPVSLIEYEPPHFVGDTNPELGADLVDPVLQGHITVRYDISTRGRPTDLELVEAQPPEFEDMQRDVQRAIRRQVFRPVFADGEVIETKNRIYVHDFRYRQSDLDAVREPAPADEESS